jgi:hypothetical protein
VDRHRQVVGQADARKHRGRFVVPAAIEQRARPEADRVRHGRRRALGDQAFVEVGERRLEVARERQRAAAEAQNRGRADGVASFARRGERGVVGRDRLFVEARAEKRERRALEAESPVGDDRARRERAACRVDRGLAVVRLLTEIEGAVGEQQVAAEAAVQRPLLERLHQLGRDRVVRLVPPGRDDDLGLEPLVELGMLGFDDLVVGAPVHGDRLSEPVRVEELAAELDRDLRTPHGVVEQRQPLGEMIGGAVRIAQALGEAEIDQHLAALGAGRALQRTRQVADRDVGRALGQRAGCSGPKSRDEELVVTAACQQEVGRSLLGRRAGREQDLRGAAVRIAPGDGVERFTDRRAHDGVEEFDRLRPVSRSERTSSRAARAASAASRPARAATCRSSVPSPRMQAASINALASSGSRARRSETARLTACGPRSSSRCAWSAWG